jgi:hypothetical protein
MLPNKYDVEKNGYIDYLTNFSSSGQFFANLKRGGGGGTINNGFFRKLFFYQI